MSNQFINVLLKVDEIKALCKKAKSLIESFVPKTTEADGLDDPFILPALSFCNTVVNKIASFRIIPRSFDTFFERLETEQQAIKAFVSNKELYLGHNLALMDLSTKCLELGEQERFSADFAGINLAFMELMTKFEELSESMNELLKALTSTPRPSTKWIDSSHKRRNLCGFASFVLPLNRIIVSPTMLYSDTTPPLVTKKFMAIYRRELDNMDANHLEKMSKELTVKQIQDICSFALKKAFAQTILDDSSDESPFDKTIEIVMAQFMTPDDIGVNVNDYTDLLGPFITQNNQVLNLIYQQYKVFINARIDESEEIIEAEAKHYLKSEVDKDKALPANVKIQVKVAVDADETIPLPTKVLLKAEVDKDQALETSTKTQIKAAIDADKAIKHRAKASRRDNQYVDVTRFIKYLREKHPEFMLLAKQHYCQKLMNPTNSYMAMDHDMAYMANQLGLRSLTINSITYNREVIIGTKDINTATGRASLTVKNRGFHWQAMELLVPPHNDQELRTTLGSIKHRGLKL